MTAPRWAESQRAIEKSLTRGPKTIPQLRDETGYSYSTVVNALRRAETTKSREQWPVTYALVHSAFDPEIDSHRQAPEAEPVLVHIVEPLSIPPEELGPRWQEARKKLGEEISSIDLQVIDLQKAIKHLEIEAASILGALLVLRSVKDGPDWREQIGLAP